MARLEVVGARATWRAFNDVWSDNVGDSSDESVAELLSDHLSDRPAVVAVVPIVSLYYYA